MIRMVCFGFDYETVDRPNSRIRCCVVLVGTIVAHRGIVRGASLRANSRWI